VAVCDHHRGVWRYYGQQRPPFAAEPASGQESVWDYPRPPRVEADSRLVVVRYGDVEIARSVRSQRVLETASPPTFYLPPQDVHVELLRRAAGASRCEWKGDARYWSLVAGGRRVEEVAWSYPSPRPGFERIRDHFAFYPGRVECEVNGVRVAPQPGLFYGGWITPDVVGPFKGERGSEWW
jgi:uncharacterized protein (DUF427 family)